MKRLFAVLLLTALLLCSCSPELEPQLPDPVAEVQALLGEKLEKGELYAAADVSDALLSKSIGPAEQEILDAVLLPTSLGITLPKLNTKKVWSHREVLLSNYPNGGMGYVQNLVEQGYAEIDPAEMTYQEYQLLAQTWEISNEELLELTESYKGTDDITQWTKGQKKAYEEQQEWEAILADVTEEQKAQMNDRNILLEDLPSLLDEYQTVEMVLKQSDEELKELLEDYYEIDLEFYLGEDTHEALTGED